MALLDALEAEAIEQLQCIRDARVYQGTNPDYRHRAKTAISVIGNYVRLRQTLTNDRSNDLIERRMNALELQPAKLIE